MNQNAYYWVKTMPKKYCELAIVYMNKQEFLHKRSRRFNSLPDCLKSLIPWHPGGTTEGYGFWSEVYYFYTGLRNQLPDILDPYSIKFDPESKSYSFQSALAKGNEAKEILEDLFGKLSADRRTVNVSMRMILFTYIYTSGIAGLSLNGIGIVVARLCNRKKPYTHCTVLHALSEHNSFISIKEKMYFEMWKLFNQRLDEKKSILHEYE